jgi:pyridoxine 5'-phosphate synthase PdxJ
MFTVNIDNSGTMFLDENGKESTLEEIIEQYKKKGMEVSVSVEDAEIYIKDGDDVRKEIRKNCTVVRMK